MNCFIEDLNEMLMHSVNMKRATTTSTTTTKPNTDDENSCTFEEEFHKPMPQLKVIPLHDDCTCSSCSDALSSSILFLSTLGNNELSQEPIFCSAIEHQPSSCSSAPENEEEPQNSTNNKHFTKIEDLLALPFEKKSTSQQAQQRGHRRQRNLAMASGDFDDILVALPQLATN